MRKIPFSPPDITEEEICEVADTLRSGWVTTGPRTKEFEKEIASYCHTNRAVCLNSATACMEMTLRLFGIGEGDEVITTAYTYTATASVVCHTGAKLVLVDVGETGYEMDYEAVINAITPATKAIMPVDLAGVMCDYEKLFAIVRDKQEIFCPSDNKYQKALGRILILADSAHGFGAMRNGRRSGEVADFTSFSFHAVKNLTTAEGGAVTWRGLPGVDDEEIYRDLMLLSLHGQSKDALAKTKAGAWEYDILSPAYKCNMTDIMAAMGRVQLKRYDALLARRKEIISMYDEGIRKINEQLSDYQLVSLRHYDETITSSGHLYLMRVLGAGQEQRNVWIQKMSEMGVATNVHYKPLPMLTAYKNLGFDMKNYPHAYHLFENEISLPLHTKLSDEDVEYVLACLERCL